MSKRFDAVSSETVVLRQVKIGGSHLPPGQRLPLPNWLNPTREDVKDALKTGRRPGLSVWDAANADHDRACWWRGPGTEPTELRSFFARVGSLTEVANVLSKEVEVVHDPLDVSSEADRLSREPSAREEALRSTAAAHCLIEGLKRPEGGSKNAWKNLRAELAELFSETAD